MKSGQIQQRRGIYLTQDFWHLEGYLILKICSLVYCYSSVTTGHCIFQTVTYSWMGGIRRIEQTNSKLTELCASQWYICQAELKEVYFKRICWQCHHRWKHFDSFGELLSSLEITNSKFSTSELLITSEIVEHQTIFCVLILWILTSNYWGLQISWVTGKRKHQLYHQTRVQPVQQQ